MKWPPLRPESENFLHFDAIRIVGAMLVILVHWRSKLSVPPDLLALADRLESLTLLVDMFFVLSGFVICHIYAQRMGSLRDYVSFLQRRIARVGPLHWATFAFFAAIGLAAPLFGYQVAHPENYDFSCSAPNLLFTHAFGVCDSLTFNFPSWSISAEMACYAALPLFIALYRVNVWLPGAGGLALIAALTLAGPLGPDGHPWYFLTYDSGLLRAAPAFGLGVTLYGVRGLLKRVRYASAGMYATFAAMVALTLAGASPLLLMPLVYLLAICGAAADVKGEAGPVTRALAPFGALSFSVYLLHVPFEVVVFTLGFDKLMGLSPAAMNVAILASAPALVLVAYVSFVAFETPARRWISSLGRVRAPAPANANEPQPAARPARAPPQRAA